MASAWADRSNSRVIATNATGVLKFLTFAMISFLAMSQIRDPPHSIARSPTKWLFERLFRCLQSCETSITSYPVDNRRRLVVQAFDFARDVAFENAAQQVARDLMFERQVSRDLLRGIPDRRSYQSSSRVVSG